MRQLLFLPLLLYMACSRQDSDPQKNTLKKGDDAKPMVLENNVSSTTRALDQKGEEFFDAPIIKPPNPVAELAAKNIAVIRGKASRGDAVAQVDLGLMYFHGIKVPRDHVLAQRWWQNAARQGHSAAIQNLSILIQPTKREAISFFGTQGQGNSFVFIIDKSGSMDGERLARAKRELVATLRLLPVYTRFMVYFFDDVADPMLPRGMMAVTPTNLQSAMRWVMGRACRGGGTEPVQAIQQTFRLQPDTIWLLSDGVFDNSNVALVKKLNANIKARINTLAFHDRTGESLLQAIAKENGGSYRFVAAGR